MFYARASIRATLSKAFVLFVLVFITALPGTALAEPDDASHAQLSEIEPFVDDIITEQLSDHEIPGAVISVVEDGKTTLAKGYGEADIESGTEMDPDDTVLYAASEAKLFTAEAILQLIEDGKLDPHADVNKYLSSVTIADTYPDDPITTEHLLTYTSGFDNDIYGWAQWEDEAPALSEFAADEQPPRVRKPGQLSAYNNYDYVLMGLLIEDITGMPYSDYVNKNIFAPLGMDSTSAAPQPPKGLEQRLAKAYRPTEGVQTETFIGDRSSPAAPAGGDTITTSSDMARYMIGQLESTDKTMQEQHFAAHDNIPGMGYAFEQRHYGGHTVVLKDGDLPGTHHNVALLPEYGIGIHIAYNGDGTDGGASWRGKELIHDIIDEYLPDTGDDGGHRGIGGDVSRYAGEYRDTRASHSNFTGVQTLTGPVTVEATGDGTLSTVGLSENPDVSTQNWVQMRQGEFVREDGGASLAFTPDGSLVTSQTPQAGYERIGWYESPMLHLALVSVCVTVLLAGFIVIPALGLTRKIRRGVGTWSARIAWSTAWMSTLCAAMFVTGFVLVLRDSNRLMEMPLTGDLTLSIALNTVTVMALFVAGALVMTATSWWKRWWTGWGRVWYSLIAVSGVGFMWVAITYGLIGFPLVITV